MSEFMKHELTKLIVGGSCGLVVGLALVGLHQFLENMLKNHEDRGKDE